MASAPTRTRSVRLFQTAPHACGYYADRQAQDLLLDPWETQLGEAYATAVAAGFRRSGGQVYRPRCEACRACRPLRLPLQQPLHMSGRSYPGAVVPILPVTPCLM